MLSCQFDKISLWLPLADDNLSATEPIVAQFSIPVPPWKCKKTKRFLMFSEGIEMEHWLRIGYYKLADCL